MNIKALLYRLGRRRAEPIGELVELQEDERGLSATIHLDHTALAEDIRKAIIAANRNAGRRPDSL